MISISMAHLIRAARRNLLISSSSYPKSFSSLLLRSRFHSTAKITNSPVHSNILRILNNEVDYQSEYAPPHSAATGFYSFAVEDHPGEQWMTMRRRFSDTEDIKVDATMFDGFERVLKGRDYDSYGEEESRLHISVLVDIRKKDGTDALAFECSAWPDCLEIRKVYSFGCDQKLSRPYLGPDFRGLSDGVRKVLREYLEERGVNDELCVFLHEYMGNKDRIEVIQWFKKLRSFIEE